MIGRQTRNLLGTLLRGALLERGAIAEESFSESLVLRLGEERVDVAEMVALLGSDPEAGRATLNRWAARFESPAEVATGVS